MKKYLSYLLLFQLFFSYSVIFSNTFPKNVSRKTNISIKLAILDSFETKHSVSTTFKNIYISGIDTAVYFAKKSGIDIQYKIFELNGSLYLDALKKIPEVKKWQPDVIIGSHHSAQFLLLKNFFRNILVLSPSATDSQITSMPNNFHSLSLPNNAIAKAIIIFIRNKFPNRNIFVIREVDCSSCSDVSDQFIQQYHLIYPNKFIFHADYLSDDVSHLNLGTLLKKYRRNDIILLPNTAYNSGVLMGKIVNFLKIPGIIFIGTDNWGSPTISQVERIKAIYPYQAFQVSEDISKKTRKQYQQFLNTYQKLFHSSTPNYMSFSKRSEET